MAENRTQSQFDVKTENLNDAMCELMHKHLFPVRLKIAPCFTITHNGASDVCVCVRAMCVRASTFTKCQK